jgi:dipeptidyl aminopeptidase/acylaminoacyl peptidase
MKNMLISLAAFLCSGYVFAQTPATDDIDDLKDQLRNLSFQLDRVRKANDDILWFEKVGDVAWIDKVSITGPPAKAKNPTAQGAGNPMVIYAYVFIPKNVDINKRYPLVIYSHGGVHGDFNTFSAHIVRELTAQGYVVVAPEYRGSTGYGRGYWEAIDYGDKEVVDANTARDYVVGNYSFVDKDRVGTIGWSHGGMITLLDIFANPDEYKVAYAGVPVSDLIARMGYKSQSYRDLFAADYHLGKDASENVQEYRKRSPVWNTNKLKTPLLVHTNTNDEDVNSLEVEQLIKSFKAENKKFEYHIYENIEGGHIFDRIDTRVGKEIRFKVYKFINQYLNPPKAFQSLKDMEYASYYFQK